MTRWWRLAPAIALAGMLAGCAPATQTNSAFDAVIDERANRAEARVDTLLASYADYLVGRWPGIQLPQTTIEAWLDPAVWGAAFEDCASAASGLTVRIDPNEGVLAQPPPQNAEQLRAFERSIYVCHGRLPPPSLAVSDPGPIEIAWVSSYARDTLPACLRREGVTVAPLPGDPFAIVSGGSTPGWDPYATARSDAPELSRLQAVCPHPSTLLGSLSAVGEPFERSLESSP